MKVKRVGQCCEECVTSKDSCRYEGVIRYHGDMWNGTGCEFCMCERGQVLCQRVECARLECLRVCAQFLNILETYFDANSSAVPFIQKVLMIKIYYKPAQLGAVL